MSEKARWRLRPDIPAGGWLAGLGLLLVLAAALVLPRHAVAELETEPIVVGLVLNDTLLADSLLIYREVTRGPARAWLPAKEAAGWRLDTSTRPRRDFGGASYVAFCGMLDKCIYDDSSALLTLDLPAADLLSLRFGGAQPFGSQAAAPPAGGAYLNYDLTAWYAGRPGAAGFIEGRMSTSLGHGALRLVAAAGAGQPTATLAQGLWQVDLPARGISLQAGSIATPDNSFGNGMPLTGLRIGSNALLDPTRSNALQPRIEGLAERSLRADVFVDGMFRQTAQVPYGPYSVELTPYYPGRGDIELRSTDVAGRQVRVLLPYYQAPQMLAPGASEWSLDAGRPTDTTTRSGGARPWLLSGTLRRGMNRSLTLQAQALVAQRASRLALSTDIVQPRFGLSSLSAVWQPTPRSAQPQWWLGLGHEYSSRSASIALKMEQSLDGGSRPAAGASLLAERLGRPERRFSAQFGATLGGRWSAALALDSQTDTLGRRASAAALNLRFQANSRSQLGLTLQRLSTDRRAGTALMLTWSQPLGRAYTGQVALQRQNGHDPSLLWSLQSLPAPETAAATGLAAGDLQVSGALGGDNNIGARWTQHAPQADWRVEARTTAQGAMAALGASGSIGLVSGRAFASRRIGDAFVLVDTGVPGLPVLLDNREVARTNADGWAVVSDARAHQPNLIGVDASSLPIQYAMPQDQQTVVPSLASGMVAHFDVSDGGVSLTVRDAQGQPLPAGSLVKVSTQRLPTAVTSAGEIFIERSDREAQITIEWGRQRCSLRYLPQQRTEGAYRCAAP